MSEHNQFKMLYSNIADVRKLVHDGVPSAQLYTC